MFSDVALAQRLERAEASMNAAFVEARARLFPDSGATWMERAGAYAMFDGVGSPLTQTFGLGMFSLPEDEDFDALEQFFVSRGAEVFHEVSPLADMRILERLGRRGYRPVDLTTMLFRPIGDVARTNDVATRIIESGEEVLWAETASVGWSSDNPGIADYMRDLGRITANTRGTLPFLAEIDGRAIAAGTLAIHEGIAVLAGASTIPSERKQGAQRALLETRLQYAKEHGCDLAMMGALPGSASQRNAERQGFRIAYTRIKWGRSDRA